MKRGHRKFIAALLVVGGVLAAPVLHFLGGGQNSTNPLGMVAGATARQDRLLQWEEMDLRPAEAPAPESPPAAESPPPEDSLPPQHRLLVEVILQNPELPNGCEATALAMVLQYHGYDVDKMALAYDYIPLQEFALAEGRWTGGNPELVYPGDPAGAGYYCLPRVVAGAANRYLSRQEGAQHIARNVSGADQEVLKGYLVAGAPVLVWKTIDDEPPAQNPDTAWYLAGTEELYQPYTNLHVVVLTGYDEDYFYLSDPQDLHWRMPIGQLMENYSQMGSRAVAII